jgi:hypothetical protein
VKFSRFLIFQFFLLKKYLVNYKFSVKISNISVHFSQRKKHFLPEIKLFSLVCGIGMIGTLTLSLSPRLQSWALFAEISGAKSLGEIGAGA